jgi:hypothetical protein
MKTRAVLIGVAVAALVAAVVLGIQASGKGGGGGFYGPGTLAADINITLEVLLVLGLTFGAFLARSGRIESHRQNQTIWVLVNSVLVALIMAPSFGSNFKLKSVADAHPDTLITALHAVLGTLTVIAGLWLVLQMNDVLPERLHVMWWKNLMRVTLAGYWIVALLGLAIYYFWYAA